MLRPFDWYTLIALAIAAVIIVIVLIGTGLPWRKRPPRG